MQHMC